MAGAEGDKPASPAPEATPSPQQAAAAASEPKKDGMTRVPSIPVVVRPDGAGERPAAAAAAAPKAWLAS